MNTPAPHANPSSSRPHAGSRSEQRWQAVLARHNAVDDSFVYAVKTTGIYCRPGSPSRLPRRENVEFYDSPQAAEAAGYRPSKRLDDDKTAIAARHAAMVLQACRYIEAASLIPTLDKLSDLSGMSPYHFHRIFKAHTGLTPRAYASARRAHQLRSTLTCQPSVTQALYDAGFNSSGSFYANADAVLGMRPNDFRTGATDVDIRFAVGQCSLGAILVAQSERGLCALSLGDDPDALIQKLQDQFPKANLVGGDSSFEKIVAIVVGFVEAPRLGLDLPLDVRGTAFQERVWQALREIPVGSTASYTDIARRIGAPTSARAVARACGANLLAVAIPCHRVVRTDGELSGYRWGIQRKQALLDREKA